MNDMNHPTTSSTRTAGVLTSVASAAEQEEDKVAPDLDSIFRRKKPLFVAGNDRREALFQNTDFESTNIDNGNDTVVKTNTSGKPDQQPTCSTKNGQSSSQPGVDESKSVDPNNSLVSGKTTATDTSSAPRATKATTTAQISSDIIPSVTSKDPNAGDPVEGATTETTTRKTFAAAETQEKRSDDVDPERLFPEAGLSPNKQNNVEQENRKKAGENDVCVSANADGATSAPTPPDKIKTTENEDGDEDSTGFEPDLGLEDDDEIEKGEEAASMTASVGLAATSTNQGENDGASSTLKENHSDPDSQKTLDAHNNTEVEEGHLSSSSHRIQSQEKERDVEGEAPEKAKNGDDNINGTSNQPEPKQQQHGRQRPGKRNAAKAAMTAMREFNKPSRPKRAKRIQSNESDGTRAERGAGSNTTESMPTSRTRRSQNEGRAEAAAMPQAQRPPSSDGLEELNRLKQQVANLNGKSMRSNVSEAQQFAKQMLAILAIECDEGGTKKFIPVEGVFLPDWDPNPKNTTRQNNRLRKAQHEKAINFLVRYIILCDYIMTHPELMGLHFSTYKGKSANPDGFTFDPEGHYITDGVMKEWLSRFRLGYNKQSVREGSETLVSALIAQRKFNSVPLVELENWINLLNALDFKNMCNKKPY